MNAWHFGESVGQCVLRIQKERLGGQTLQVERARSAIEQSPAKVLVPGVGPLDVTSVYLKDLVLTVETVRPRISHAVAAYAGAAGGVILTLALLTLTGIL